jgi:hypothetical protein
MLEAQTVGAFSTADARIVRLDARQGQSGLWIVTSPDVRWLLVTGRTLDEALAAVPMAYAALSAAPASCS